jgi:predicted nucleic acid-binding protein
VAVKPSAYVLDSFALLAYLEGEAGMSRIQTLLKGAEEGEHTLYVSLINLGEVLYITERENGLVQAQQALAALDQLPLQFVPVSRATALAAAHIKAHYAVAYADAFAVATAQDDNGVLVTGDPEIQTVADAGIITVEGLPRR